MALSLPIGPLKTRSGLEQVLRSEHSTYQPMTILLLQQGNIHLVDEM